MRSNFEFQIWDAIIHFNKCTHVIFSNLKWNDFRVGGENLYNNYTWLFKKPNKHVFNENVQDLWHVTVCNSVVKFDINCSHIYSFSLKNGSLSLFYVDVQREAVAAMNLACLLYTSPSPRD